MQGKDLGELLQLAEKAGVQDDDRVKKALAVLWLNPENHTLRTSLQKFLLHKATPQTVDPLPFPTLPKPEEIGGEIPLGTTLTGTQVGLQREEILQGILITGRSGAGKTNLNYVIARELWDRNIPWLAIDLSKRNFRHLIPAIPDLIVIPWNELRFNPLRNPPGTDPRLWCQIFCDITCQVFGLQAASKSMTLDCVTDLYDTHFVYTHGGTGFYPTVRELDSLLRERRKKTKSRVDMDYIDRCRNKTLTILNVLPEVTGVSKGFPEHLLGRPMVLELVGLTSELQNWLVNLLLAWLVSYVEVNEKPGGLKEVIFVDEAARVFGKQFRAGEESYLSQMARRVRQYGLALVVSDQMISSLDDSIKANSYTKICFCQGWARDIEETRRTLRLDGEQTNELSRLPVGEAVVRLSGRYTEPFILKVPHVQIHENVSDEKVGERLRDFKDSMGTEVRPAVDPPPARVEAQGEPLRSEAPPPPRKVWKEMLEDVLNHPFLGVVERYVALGLSPWVGNKTVKELIEMGLLESRKIGFGKRGNLKRYLVLTNKGHRYLGTDSGERGLHGKEGKGGFQHRLIQHMVKEKLDKEGHRAVIEGCLNGKMADLVYVYGQEEIAVEIELDPGHEHVVDNIRLDLKAGFSRVVVLTREKDKLDSLKARVRKLPRWDSLKDRIDFGLVKDFVD